MEILLFILYTTPKKRCRTNESQGQKANPPRNNITLLLTTRAMAVNIIYSNNFTR